MSKQASRYDRVQRRNVIRERIARREFDAESRSAIRSATYSGGVR